MKKIYSLLTVLSLALTVTGFSQSMSNTDNTITLTGVCLFMPAGTYTYNLTLAYLDPDNGFIPGSPISVTVVSTGGGNMTITRSSGAFPAPDNDGYWDLAYADNGSISLTGGTYSGIMFWYHNPDGSFQVDCVPLPIWYNSFTATQSGTTEVLNWQTGLEQNSTVFEIYRATTNSNSAYVKIGQVNASGNSNIPVNYTFTDPSPGPSDWYYLKELNSQGTRALYSNTVSVSCSGCTFTPPAAVNCPFTINGPDHICSLETLTAYSLSSEVPNYSTIAWSVDVPSAVKLTTYPYFDRTQVTLLKKNTAAAVTLTASMSGCSNAITRVITIGTPAPVITATINRCPYLDATMSNAPNATSYQWWLVDENTGSTTPGSSTGNSEGFLLTTSDVYDVEGVYSNGCGASSPAFAYGYQCGGFFDLARNADVAVSPNPSNGIVNIGLAPAPQASKLTAPVTHTKVYQVRVVDVQGIVRKTFNYPGGMNRLSLDLSSLNNGVYIIQVFDNKTWRSNKVILTK